MIPRHPGVRKGPRPKESREVLAAEYATSSIRKMAHRRRIAFQVMHNRLKRAKVQRRSA